MLWKQCGFHAEGSPAAFLSLASDGEVCFAVIQDPLASGAPAALRSVLAQSTLATDATATPGDNPAAPASWPRQIAEHIEQRLRRRGAGDPAWVLFAGGRATRESIEVCTAGDLRVHLLSGRSIVHRTRDHVAANESNESLARSHPGVPLADHPTLLIRSLGSGALPAESVCWPARGITSIVVCSSEIHRHRDPESYLDALLDGREGPSEGVWLRLDWEP